MREGSTEAFAHRLLNWFDEFGRNDLPWQHPRAPYRVWVSEIMLQQTQVATVIPYFERFLSAFPTVETLATATSEQVMALWSGLGYYSRARNLHRCAQQLVSEHGGEFPADRVALEALPGIGRSTAAAIMVFAHGRREAILDGNVKRVLCRHFDVVGVPDSPATLRQLWPLAERELAHSNLVGYTQGLMDLGAMVCTRNRPTCGQCPVHQSCEAFKTDRVADLPTRRKRQALPQRETTVVVAVDTRHQVFVQQRPDAGIWGGLLSLPESSLDAETRIESLLDDTGLSAHVVLRQTAGLKGLKKAGVQRLTPIEHVFTHFRLRLHPVLVAVESRPTALQEGGFKPLLLQKASGAALPKPIKSLLEELASKRQHLWRAIKN